VARDKDAMAGVVVAAGAVGVFVSGCFTCALLLVLVDVGRSLRTMRRQTTKGSRNEG
jgi:hypothetical protein